MEQMNTTQRNPLMKKKINPAKKQEYLFVTSLLAVPILFFLVFWLYVNFDSFVLAFQREKNGEAYFTLENFKAVFDEFLKGGGEYELVTALKNTLLFFTVNLVLVIPLTLLMAYFIYKRIAGYKVFRTVTYLPNIITSSALVVLFKYTFQSGGTYNALTGVPFLEYSSPLESEKAIYMLVLYNVIFGFGTNMVIFGGAMNSISSDVLEAGEIDGCNWFQELIYLIIPMMWPTISTLLILCFSSILSATGPILAMTKGNYGTRTLAFSLYSLATGVGGSKDTNLAAAIGTVMTLIAFPLVLLIRKVIFREGKE